MQFSLWKTFTHVPTGRSKAFPGFVSRVHATRFNVDSAPRTALRTCSAHKYDATRISERTISEILINCCVCLREIIATVKRHILSDHVWGDACVIWKAATTGGRSRYLLFRCVAVTLSASRLHRLVLPLTVHASGRSVWEPRVHVTLSGSWGRGFEKKKMK